VLANGFGDKTIREKSVRSHVPTLRIAVSDIVGLESLALPGTSDAIVEWRLNGVRVRIENAIDEAVRDDSFNNCIPRLGQLTPDVGPPSKAAVEDGMAELTSCIFDVTGGRLQGGSNQPGAALALLSTKTESAPLVSITSFATGERGELQLRDGAQMTLSNLGATGEDDDLYDFYLHYTLAERMPDILAVPPPSPCRGGNHPSGRTWPPGFKSVGPGCSNSAYP
jgi:hypothetical protein